GRLAHNWRSNVGRTLRRSKTLAAASAILALPLAGAITASAADDPAFAGPRVISTLPGGTWAAATGDFDRDGRLDLATADGSDTLQVLEPGPSGRSGWRRAGVRAGTTNFFLRAADLDGDGDEDLVVADVAGAVVTLRCRGDGTFDAPEAVPQARRARWVTAGDWEGDGTVDLAVAQFDLQSVAV